MKDQRKAILYALGAVLLWSTVASAFKISLRYLEPVQLLLYAVATSIVVLSVIIVVGGKARSLFALKRRELMASLLPGFLNPFLYYIVLFEAYDLLPAQEAQPLNYTWAITLTLLSVPLLKQKIGLREIAATLVGYSGVVVIATHGDVTSFRLSSPLGVALALGSTIIWALYWILNTRDNREPVVALLLNFIVSLPLVLIACVALSTPIVTSPEGLLGALYVGVFEMGLAFVLWLKALKLSSSTAKVSTLIFLSPFLSLVFIRIFVGEKILLSTVVGLVLIVAGLSLQHIKGRER